MSFIPAIVVSAAVSLAVVGAAPAMTVADLGQAGGLATSVGFSFSDEIAPGRPGRLDRFDAEAARAYFDYDALITLGALALAGGAVAAFGAARRKADDKAGEDSAEPAWRAPLMAAVQADLLQFTANFRRAA